MAVSGFDSQSGRQMRLSDSAGSYEENIISRLYESQRSRFGPVS